MKQLMKFTVVIFLLCLLKALYGFTPIITENFKAIHIKTKYEFLSPDGNVMNFDYSPDLICSDHYTILRQPYTINQETVWIKSDSTDSTSNESVETAYHYYIAKNGTHKALYYRTLDEKGKSENLDSVINKYLNVPFQFYQQLIEHPENTTFKKQKREFGLLETIKINDSTAINEPDSFAYYYTKAKLERSFKSFEKEKKGTLYKVDMLFKPTVLGKKNIPQRSFNFEVTEVPVPDPKTLKVLIEKFEKEINGKQ